MRCKFLLEESFCAALNTEIVKNFIEDLGSTFQIDDFLCAVTRIFFQYKNTANAVSVDYVNTDTNSNQGMKCLFILSHVFLKTLFHFIFSVIF